MTWPGFTNAYTGDTMSAEENARALAYQAQERSREAARRQREGAMKGNPARYAQLYENTKALMRSWGRAPSR